MELCRTVPLKAVGCDEAPVSCLTAVGAFPHAWVLHSVQIKEVLCSAGLSSAERSDLAGVRVKPALLSGEHITGHVLCLHWLGSQSPQL